MPLDLMKMKVLWNLKRGANKRNISTEVIMNKYYYDPDIEDNDYDDNWDDEIYND